MKDVLSTQPPPRPFWLWTPWPWIALGLAFWVLNLLAGDGPTSRFWFADIPLYALIIAGLLINRGQGLLLRLPRPVAPIAFILLSWTFGMMYEASLTVDGSGVGGVHPDTRASYILAQGDYIMLAVVSWAVIRRFHLNFRDVFFLAGGISLTEGLVFTGVLTAVLLSPQFLFAPLFLAYYTLAYATFVALPLLILDPATLWSGRGRTKPLATPYLWLLGAGLAFVIRLIWGLGWAPLATWVFDLPPNLPGI